MDSLETTHVLNARVMCLNHASLQTTYPFLHEPWDTAESAIRTTFIQDSRNDLSLPDFTHSSALKVPDSVPDSYLGEALPLYIRIQNEGVDCDATDVSFNFEMKSPRHHTTLHTDGPIKTIICGQSVDRVLNHELNDLGTHTLICSISYIKRDEKMLLSRNFSFDVSKPIDIKTKYVTPEYREELILEAQIQNTTLSALKIESILLKSTPYYKVKPLNQVQYNNKDGTSEGYNQNLVELKHKEVHAFLFKITPEIEMVVPPKEIGKLDIIWKRAFGQRGRLQTGNLERPVRQTSSNIRLFIKSTPSKIQPMIPFDFEIEIYNLTKSVMKLVLNVKQLTQGISWCGLSNYSLEELEGQKSLNLRLPLVAFLPGEHIVGGISLHDLNKSKTYKFENICKIFVEN